MSNELEVTLINSNVSYPPEIDNFLEDSINGSVFHSPRFLSYHQEKFSPETFIWQHFEFKKKGKIIAFLPGMIIKDNEKEIFKSPFASSIGGFVWSKNVLFKDAEEVLNCFLDRFHFSETMIGNSPTYYDGKRNVCTYMDYLLLKSGFQIIQSDLILVYHMSEQPITERIQSKTKTELNQALKLGILHEVEDTVTYEMYSLLLQSQKRLQSKPTHSFEELKRLENLFPNRIKSFSARIGKELLGGIICIEVNRRILNIFYVFDTEEGRKFKVNQFNFYQVIKWGQTQGYSIVDFGPSSFGFEPNRALIFFKEKWDTTAYQRLKYQK